MYVNNYLLHQCVLLLLVSKQSFAILAGGHQQTSGNAKNPSDIISNETSGNVQIDQQTETINQTAFNNAALGNTTFYYEANTFLINKNEASRGNEGLLTNDNKSRNGTEASDHSDVRSDVSLNGNDKLLNNASWPAPASLAMTSGRNGRMLDLDALMGDFAASRANKERHDSGNRQSRFLGSPTLDIGSGKRLHIQGFIPIVGVKDVTEMDQESVVNNDGASGQEQAYLKQQQQQQQLLQQQLLKRLRATDLPYEQSSLGHATFGVQRYLNGESQPIASQQQVEAKYNSGSMLATLKRPLKRLTEPNGSDMHQEQQQQTNCLCVPFYMCKNGFISESSLGKSQIQQLLTAQQPPQQLSSSNTIRQSELVEMKSGGSQLMMTNQRPPQTTTTIDQSQTQQPQAQYADSYVPVDERSLDREVITMAPNGLQLELGNQSTDFTSSNMDGTVQQQQQNQMNLETAPGDDIPNSSMSIANATINVNEKPSEYSQEILGRMLGLKSHTSKNSPYQSFGGSQATQSSHGVCGLLRSCCQVPNHLIPSQQDVANERLMAQYGNSHINKQSQQPQQQPWSVIASDKHSINSPGSASTDLIPQQAVALQRYQQQPLQQQRQQISKMPYGFPITGPRNPLLNIGSPNSIEISNLAHRTSQFQAPLVRPSGNVNQYSRAVSPITQLQQHQSHNQYYPQAKASPVPLNTPAITTINQQQLQHLQTMPSQVSRNLPGSGSRKILEGRCGLRQAAGITGRVQNLQYHDSSTEFGEYPAQAAILKRLGNSESLFVCGGTLISQYWVATAAHCIKKHNLSDLKIRLGEWDVHRDDEFYPHVEKEVRDLVVHPEFVSGNLINDIALLRLDSAIDPTLPHVNPACLPTIDESFIRQRCWVTGWGKDSFGQKGSFQSVLRKVELPVVGQAECENALRSTRLGPHYRLHSGFICAGGEGGKDACEGDGGSGLYCLHEGVIKVAGLVSWGIGCGQAGVPGVYISMAHYRPWIENIISIDEDIYSPYTNMISNSLISERSNTNNTKTEAEQDLNNSTISTAITTTAMSN